MWSILRTNLKDSFRMFTKLFNVFVGSLGCGGGYGNCNKSKTRSLKYFADINNKVGQMKILNKTAN